MNIIKIGITGTGSLIGQAIIKSLNNSDLKDKIDIIGFDYFEETVGGFWSNKNYILPDILKPNIEKNWIETVTNIIDKEQIEVLFIGLDFELLLFAKYKEKIEKQTNCKIVVSNEKLLNIGNDKYFTYQFLKEHNINYPETYLVSDVNKDKIEYPCIIKPRVGARSKGVYIVKNKEDLEQKIQIVNEPVIQELIGTDDTEYTCGILCFDGKIIDTIALKRSLKEGNTFIAEYKKDFPQVIYEYIEKIANELKPFGPCNLQLRLGKDEKPFLFEINPRFSGTTYFRHLFGFKEVEYTVKHLLNMETSPFKMKEGKAFRYFDEKLLN